MMRITRQGSRTPGLTPPLSGALALAVSLAPVAMAQEDGMSAYAQPQIPEPRLQGARGANFARI